MDEGTDLRRAIQRIAADYDVKWKLEDERGDHDAVAEELEQRRKKSKKKEDAKKEDD